MNLLDGEVKVDDAYSRIRGEFLAFLRNQGFPAWVNDEALYAAVQEDLAYAGKRMTLKCWSWVDGAQHDDDVALVMVLSDVPKAKESSGVLQQHEERVKPGYYADFPVEKIMSNPFSFRLKIEEGIEELVGEIGAAGMIIEPLVCRPASKPSHVEIGPGERRLAAAKRLGLKTVPLTVREFTDAEFDRIRLLENLARKDLNDMEIARTRSKTT